MPEREAPHRRPDKQYLQELFIEQGLSVTALNNYLKCPWTYFYQNLIRIPKTPNRHMLMGTAVHAALNRYFTTLARGDTPSKEVFLEFFENRLKSLPLSRGEIEEVRKRGLEALSGWFEERKDVWGPRGLSEYRISVLAPLPSDLVPTLKLRGDIDRMEFLREEGGEVRVIDFKTGSPKTRNEILGKTKDATGDYYRQLVFYKILLDQEGKYAMQSGAIDFIQPDSRPGRAGGKWRLEEFEITEADTEELRKTIAIAAESIWNLSFWETKCDDAECEYCELRALIEV
jgi:DNA helicase-2/ATP-dependent DNA helicase PcrA